MARLARVIAIDVPHHVTQRANARRYILTSDEQRRVYLNLLREYCALYQLEIVGYCLMSNHVHLVAVPRRADSLAQTMKYTHGRYASYWNATAASSGHAWKGRFHSCSLDEDHLWAALRYTELNPVRAKMVGAATGYVWSSAAAHCGLAPAAEFLHLELWQARWNYKTWGEYLGTEVRESELEEIRQCTHTGRPLGTEEFVKRLEETLLRRLSPQKGGRPAKLGADDAQAAFAFKE